MLKIWVSSFSFRYNAGDAYAFGNFAMNYVNDKHLDPALRPEHDFHRIGMSLPMLSHKAGHDLNIPAFIVEVSRPGNHLRTQTRWHLAFVQEMLQWYGLMDSQRNTIPWAYQFSSSSTDITELSTMTVGDTRQAFVGVTNNNTGFVGDITKLSFYSSSNQNVAAVSLGAITAVGTGTTTITATYGDRVATFQLRVVAASRKTNVSFDDLSIHATNADGPNQIINDYWLIRTKAPGQYSTFQFSVPQAGTYDIRLIGQQYIAYGGISDVYINGVLKGQHDFSAIDQDTPLGQVMLGAGTHTIKLTAVDKHNSSSAGYYQQPKTLELIRMP
jgi:hypothetical protein